VAAKRRSTACPRNITWLNQLPENPYTPPNEAQTDNIQSGTRSANSQWHWGVYSIVCAVVSIVPFYGFYTRGGRESQFTVLWLMLAWAATVINIIVCLFRSAVLTKAKRSRAIAWLVFSIFLSVALFFGFYGIGHAVVELWVS